MRRARRARSHADVRRATIRAALPRYMLEPDVVTTLTELGSTVPLRYFVVRRQIQMLGVLLVLEAGNGAPDVHPLGEVA